MNVPEILNVKSFIDAPLRYKWDETTSNVFYGEVENEKISYALWKLNHKATYGIAASLCEWIYWRMPRYINHPLAIQCIEAQWASIVDKRYSFDWFYDEEYVSDSVNGPIYSMLSLLELPRKYYYAGDIFVDSDVERLAMLARHIITR